MPGDVTARIDLLSLERLDALGDELFEVTSLEKLRTWLTGN
ncbi:DUF4351 domain-containing protein [Leptothoe kymatousa]